MKGNALAVVLVVGVIAAAAFFILRDAPQDTEADPMSSMTPLGTPVRTIPPPPPANQY